MRRVLVSMVLVGAAALLLSGCEPYWDDPYYGYGPGLSPRQYAKMNDPAWCNYHPQHCAALHARAGAPPPGYGPPPPPPPGYKGPPPNYNGGPPPGYNAPPPADNGDANGPPQQMQPPPPQQQ